ncbi:MAG: type II secretion system F family protein [Victivallaceae bacterium]
MEELIIYSTVFLAVIFAVWAIAKMVSDSAGVNKVDSLPPLFRIFETGINFFSDESGALLADMFPKKTSQIKIELAKADIGLTPKDIYGATLFFMFLGLILGSSVALCLPSNLFLQIFCGLIFVVLGMMLPRMYIQKLAEVRMVDIMNNLPFAIDLLSSSMNAGLDFGAAVRYLLASGKEDRLRKEFSMFLRDVELGKTRSDALRDMQQRIMLPDFTRFATAVSYGIDSGTSIIEIMRIQAEEMRRVKFARAEQQAAKAPTKMIVPMAIFVFPSMFIIIFIPIFLRIKDSGMLNMVGK